MKLVSLFFDLEDAANKYYNDTQVTYTCHAQNAETSLQKKKKKSIAWVAYYGSAYNIIADTYHTNLIQDAGTFSYCITKTRQSNSLLFTASMTRSLFSAQVPFP